MASRYGPARVLLVGLLAGVVVSVVLVTVIGVDEVLAALAAVSPPLLAAVVAGSFATLVVWGLALRAVYGGFGRRVPRRRAVAAYAGVAFANRVAPFAQLGTEPVAAAVVSRTLRSDYETSLAAVLGVDVGNFATSLALATFGLAYFTTSDVLHGDVVVAALALLATALALLAGGGLAWRSRHRLPAAVAGVVVSLGHLPARVVPSWSPPSAVVVAERVERFVADLERLAAAPRALAAALSFSALGWVLLAVTLHLSLLAVGERAPLVTPLFVVPLAQLAVVVPLPGGVGSVETALVVLLVAAAGVSPATAAAATVVYRGAVYWLALVVTGSVTAAALSAAESA